MNRAGKTSGNTVKFLNEDLLKQIQRRLLHGPQQIVGSTYIKLYSLLSLFSKNCITDNGFLAFRLV